MTENVLHGNMESFENPDNVPLEKLNLTLKTGGVTENVAALDKRWASDYHFLHYEPPQLYDINGIEIMGSKEHWMKIVQCMIDDLKWLLSLPFYKFWSNIVYNASILNALVSFLQDAPPFYALENFPNYPDMLELLNTLSHNVLVVFARLVTEKESLREYMSREYLGNLLYDNYIFTVPIIFDLCQLYGRENEKVLKNILNCLFKLEPRYNYDLRKAVPCLIEAFENVEMKFDHSNHNTTKASLLLQQRANNSTGLTLFNLHDMILYVLDISSTINIFLKNYPPAVSIFHQESFMNKLVVIYEGTFPEMYKMLNKLAYNNENMPKYMELKHRLDVTRIEILSLFRIITYEPILNIKENFNTISETETKEQLDKYLTLLMTIISEKEFITDYDQFYSVQTDLKNISTMYPEIDTMKRDYILQGMNTIIEKCNAPSANVSNHVNEIVAGPSGISTETIKTNAYANLSTQKQKTVNSVELRSIISGIQDILGDSNEQFIERCLEHYGYNSEAVLHAIFEDKLPPELMEQKDSQMVNAPTDNMESLVNENLVHAIGELNLNNNYDNVQVKKKIDIEVPKDYIKQNYSLIVDVYDDEYDDTYENRDIRGNARDDSIEVDSRPFTTPRVLLGKQKVETAEDSEIENEDTDIEQNERDQFVENPEAVRARAEQRWQATRGRKNTPNVTGKPRGQGQEKDVLYNRQQKNNQKARRGNHNRRSGAQYKRNQGMVPS